MMPFEQPIMFANILDFRQNLKIPGHMQSAHERALQGHDVINIMSNAGLACQFVSAVINSLNRRHFHPWWRGCDSPPPSFPIVGKPVRGISAFPSLAGLARRFFIGHTPFRTGCGGTSVRADLTDRVATIGCVLGAPIKVAEWFRHLTFATRLQACRHQCRTLCALSRERRILLVRYTSLADTVVTICSATRFLTSDPKFIKVRERLYHAALATRFTSHFVLSICRSMMRRTNSAIEIPNFLASRRRKARWGSVKEIICFVITVRIPKGIPVCQVAVGALAEDAG